MSKKPKGKKDIKDGFADDIIDQFGDVLLDAAYIIDNPPPLIPVTPKLDIALGGGVPEGSLFIMTGPEKLGKSAVALHFCKNAQNIKLEDGSDRKIIYGNVEGRVKKRDLEGIRGLNVDPKIFRLAGSTRGNILTGEDYLGIFDHMVHQMPHSIGVIDSFSALASKTELTEDLDSAQVAIMQKVIAKFTRRFANVLPINRVTLVGITHMMANIGAMGRAKKKTEKSGNALKYAQDVKLIGTHKIPMMRGDTQIGQEIHWVVDTTATNTPPGQKVTIYLKYGRGIWEEYEVAELGKDFGLITGGGWLTLPCGTKLQGLFNVAAYLEDNPNAYEDLKAQVFEIVGM